MLRKISSLQHPVVKHLVQLRKSRGYRYEKGAVVVEGKKLVSEVCQKQKAMKLLATEESLFPPKVQANESYLVTEEILKKISGVKTPEGVLAEVPIPDNVTFKKCRYLIALDGISDPGNLGTLLRTALALGWEGAFILNNSCDPYNDKAIRSAKGATFRLPLQQRSWSQLGALVEKFALQPLCADLKGTNIKDFSPGDGILLVLGSEAHGLSEEAKSLCRKITIPMSGNMESLNVSVAGGILMYQLIIQ
ncbi:MAG: putative tRNA/rRNA methyltransferase [Chlamydiae bacterium]|nr:putative tRNA/rRNA methyltransferase [Chlamydiota bacterium]